MITIKNRQRKIALDLKEITALVEKLLKYVGYADFDVGILITTNKTIKRFNSQYRHKDKPTDILSFPFYPDLKPGEIICPQIDDEKNLGDIIISAERVFRDAQDMKIPFEEQMQVLLIHGICHLLGYDHETDEQFALMAKKEKLLLKKLTR